MFALIIPLTHVCALIMPLTHVCALIMPLTHVCFNYATYTCLL